MHFFLADSFFQFELFMNNFPPAKLACIIISNICCSCKLISTFTSSSTCSFTCTFTFTFGSAPESMLHNRICILFFCFSVIFSLSLCVCVSSVFPCCFLVFSLCAPHLLYFILIFSLFALSQSHIAGQLFKWNVRNFICEHRLLLFFLLLLGSHHCV